MVETYRLSQHNEAEIRDNTIYLKVGIRKFEIPFNDIIGFYRYHLIKNDDLLVFFYRLGEKIKKMQTILDRSTPQPFVDELVARAPDNANLMHMSKKEALKTLGMRDGVITGFLGLAVILPIVLVGVFFPQVWHFVFDSKLVHTTIEEMYEGNLPDSNYLTFTGKLKDEGMIVSYKPWSITTRNKHWLEKGFFPIVPDNWQQGDPIKVVLMIDRAYNLKAIAGKVGQQIKFRGMVRNILWERFRWSSWMDDLAEQEQSPVENPVVMEIDF